MIKCEECGKEINELMVDIFNYDGSDGYYSHGISEYPENAVCLDVNPNWTGNELSEEEAIETIQYPHCGKFPFKSKEVQAYEYVRIVMFKEQSHEH